jgi:hypothetical protein
MASKHNLLDATDTSPLQAKSQKTQHNVDLLDEDPPRNGPDTSVVADTKSTFRFLDLPRELRYMVYERISFDTKRYELQDPEWVSDDTSSDNSSIVLVTKSLSVGILASCRLINVEARGFLAPKLALLQHSERFHFNIHTDAVLMFFELYNNGTIEDGVIQNHVEVREPRSYTLYDKTYTQEDPEYSGIDRFFKKVSSIAHWGYPVTTSIAIWYDETVDHDDQEEDLDIIRLHATGYHLSQVIPGSIRVCNVQELIEEGREPVEPPKP